VNRLIVLYFLLSTFIFARVSIEEPEINFQNFEVEYYVDEHKNLDFTEIQSKNFTKARNKKSFSSQSTHLWIKIKIENKSLKTQKLFLHHTNAYRLSYIKFYEMQKEMLINSFDMNLSNQNESQHMYGSDAIYTFKLHANESKTIYIEATSFIYQYCNIMLFDAQHSSQHLASQNLAIVVILGILTGLMFYHFILYCITFFKDYLYYSLYLFFNILWGSYEYGIMGKYFGWYGADFFIFDLMIIFAIIALSFFIKNILQTAKLYPMENRLINLMIVIFTLNLGYVFINIYTTLYLFVISMSIVSTIYIGIIISLYYKKDRYISYILFAQIWFMFFDIISLAFYEGFITYNFFTRYSFILGIFLDTFAFSYLLSHRIRLVQEENKKNIHKTKRLEALSELLENISHQWRQPLTRINSSIMYIAVEMKRNNIKNNNINKKLDNIESLSVYLSQTIDDFKSLYRKDREISLFNLYDAIQSSLQLIEPDYQRMHIQVEINMDRNLYIEGYINEFKQVLHVIFHNAKDALIHNQTTDPSLNIFAYRKNKYITLEISNNGGEIDESVIEKIFDAHFTTKKQGEGIGLFMSQKILKELMNTSLSCKNISKGVCFQITFS